MAPGRYTELFFLDEATALAAGHRPCAECRRADYNRVITAWSADHPGPPRADAIDAQLHRERIDQRTGGRRLHERPYAQLPDGVFVFGDHGPCLVLDRRLLSWSPSGYLESKPRPSRGSALVITPPSLVALLAKGWTPLVPLIHPSAWAAGGD
jgi:hypothetical protein